MKKLRQKLHSEQGVSILMALFLVFLAVMVSAIVLSASVNSARAVKNSRDSQQAYLTVSSVAEWMQYSVEQYKGEGSPYFGELLNKVIRGSSLSDNKITMGDLEPVTVDFTVSSEIISDGMDGAPEVTEYTIGATFTIDETDGKNGFKMKMSGAKLKKTVTTVEGEEPVTEWVCTQKPVLTKGGD